MSVFSGSYQTDEVEFLLTPITIEDTPIELKEHLIQTGQKHYSELLTLETLPAPEYITLFHKAMALNQDQVAEHLLSLAQQIVTTRPNGIIDGILKLQDIVQNESIRRRSSDVYKSLMESYAIQ